MTGEGGGGGKNPTKNLDIQPLKREEKEHSDRVENNWQGGREPRAELEVPVLLVKKKEKALVSEYGKN